MTTSQPNPTATKTKIVAKGTRQRFWQVIFPIVFVSLLVIGLVVYLVINARAGGISLEQLGGVATIIIILPALFGLFIVLAIYAGLIFLLGKLTGMIPNLAQKTLDVFGRARYEISKIANGAADPFIKMREMSAKATQVLGSLQKRLK